MKSRPEPVGASVADGAAAAHVPYLAVELDGTVQGAAELRDMAEKAETTQPRGHNYVNVQSFREALGLLATAVVVVTTTVDDRPWGMTISACCSVSASPPEVLISLARHTRSRDRIHESRRFGISILGAAQEAVARFAAAPGTPKFMDDLCVQDDPDLAGAPMVAGAPCHLACDVARIYPQSTHDIFVGRVYKTVRSAGTMTPLVYHDRRFGSVSLY